MNEVSANTRIRNYRLVLAFITLLCVLLVSLSVKSLNQTTLRLEEERATVASLKSANKLASERLKGIAGDLQFCEKRASNLATNLSSLQEKLTATEKVSKIASTKCSKIVASLNAQLGKTTQVVVVVKQERDAVIKQQKAAVIPQSSLWAWIKSYSPWQK